MSISRSLQPEKAEGLLYRGETVGDTEEQEVRENNVHPFQNVRKCLSATFENAYMYECADIRATRKEEPRPYRPQALFWAALPASAPVQVPRMVPFS